MRNVAEINHRAVHCLHRVISIDPVVHLPCRSLRANLEASLHAAAGQVLVQF
jgi:hypothetical protein